jgi:hypothetical protein
MARESNHHKDMGTNPVEPSLGLLTYLLETEKHLDYCPNQSVSQSIACSDENDAASIINGFEFLGLNEGPGKSQQSAHHATDFSVDSLRSG